MLMLNFINKSSNILRKQNLVYASFLEEKWSMLHILQLQGRKDKLATVQIDIMSMNSIVKSSVND